MAEYDGYSTHHENQYSADKERLRFGNLESLSHQVERVSVLTENQMTMNSEERIRFEQLASLVLGMIDADWHRPTLEQTEYILERAKSQARDVVRIGAAEICPIQNT